MTRKHFEALAAALKDSKPDTIKAHVDAGREESWYHVARMDQWRADVRAITEVCIAHNPRFSRFRFHEACGYELDNEPTRSR